ncbi:purine nucleoside phosphorylase YfiH [Obesumbacterium proteus]|uniref:purine nucleoside phosphorylase YfiH n=1 Tax=Obesumbacterium proteus TaxID=82983 RepID=UPI0024301E27|nr:purine nucleoside phosphorylase YfiH [Obesumbacterium proteus]
MSVLITPLWPAPNNVVAFNTTRKGGVSAQPYDALNLGTHVGDDGTVVAENRRRLKDIIAAPTEPFWLEQVHGTRVLRLDENSDRADNQADASYTNIAGQVCAVMTADCLPVLFCNRQGTEVAAAHAGWRGLCDGVLEQTLACFDSSPEDILAWFGPAIGPTAFEVGGEVRAKFIEQDADAEQAFTEHGEKYLADIYQLARLRLRRAGVQTISGGDLCTVSDKSRFFSYRREPVTGRMAAMIWFR